MIVKKEETTLVEFDEGDIFVTCIESKDKKRAGIALLNAEKHKIGEWAPLPDVEGAISLLKPETIITFSCKESVLVLLEKLISTYYYFMDKENFKES